jgi:uncharacterized protein (DUF2225 family)
MPRLYWLLILLLGSCSSDRSEKQNLSFTYCLTDQYGKMDATKLWYEQFYRNLLNDSTNQFMVGLIPAEDTLVVSTVTADRHYFEGEVLQADELEMEQDYLIERKVIRKNGFYNYKMVFEEHKPSHAFLVIDLISPDSAKVFQAFHNKAYLDMIEKCN